MVKRVFWVLGGLICLLVAGALLVTGVSLAFALGSSGEVSADFTSLSGPGSALVSDGLTVSPTSSFQTSFGTVTLGVHSSDGRRLFLGVAREKPLFEYLDGVPYDVVSQVTSTFATIRSVPGGETPKPPASQTFWLVQSAGESPQIDWPADAASRGYRFVVMNEDGSPAVNATLVLGFRSTRAQPASIVTSEPATPEAVTSEPATADAVTSEPAATEAVTPAEQSTSAPTETTTESPAAPPTTAPLPAPPPITPPDPPSPNP